MKFSELTEQQSETLYSRLVKSSSKFETEENNGAGVSDGHELVNQVWLKLMESDSEIPDVDNFNTFKALLHALDDLTGGTAPSRKGQNGRLKYGKFEQQEYFDVAQPEAYVHESDLDEALSYVRVMMAPSRYLDLFHPETGLVHQDSIEAFANVNDLSYETAKRRVHRARVEFLSCIPEDSQLFTYSRRLRTKYGVSV